MKKTLVFVLLYIILTNFIFINSSYATDATDAVSGLGSQSYTVESYDQAANEGTANMETQDGNQTASISESGSSVMGTIVGVLARALDIFPLLIQGFVSLVLNSGGIKDGTSDELNNLFTIENIITGRYIFLSGDVFLDMDDSSIKWKSDNGSLKDSLTDIRTNVSMWFVIVRDIAMALNLAALLYVAIRLAIATVSTEKAKYKELLYNWLISMIILFSLQYIMVVINAISDTLTNIAKVFMDNLESNGNESFETTILDTVFSLRSLSGGLRAALYSIIYWVLVWIEVKFFIMYAKRMLTIFFLVIISPFITVTYSVDKIGDGEAQAFQNWIREYSSNLFIQPIHCFTYLVFMFTANSIAKQAPLVGVLFLFSLTKAEKIVKSMIGLSGIKAMQEAGKGMSLKNLTGSLKQMAMPKPGGGK